MRSLLVLCSLLFVNVVRSRAQLSTVDMSQVVSELAGRFEAIRNDGLGIPQLEVKPINVVLNPGVYSFTA